MQPDTAPAEQLFEFKTVTAYPDTITDHIVRGFAAVPNIFMNLINYVMPHNGSNTQDTGSLITL